MKEFKKYNKYLLKNIPKNKIEYDENFNLDIAKFLLEISSLCYLDDEKLIENELKKIPYVEKKLFIDEDDSECLIISYDDILIVAFSGTRIEELNDLKADINIIKNKFENYFIHKGFLEYYKKLKFKVLKKIISLDYDRSKKIFWTGHSLGGALAIIFAYTYKKGTVYTFGCPKIGNKDFSKSVSSLLKVYRIYNEYDLIPKLPPSFLNYTHVGKDIFFKLDLENISLKNKSLIILEHLIFNFFLVFFTNDFFKNLLLNIFNFIKGVKFHSITIYRKMLNSSIFKQI